MPAMELIIPVDGGEVWAEDTGGNGLPLVLLHPGWGDSAIWDPMLRRLAARYRVIRFDMRGYGRSPAPTAPFIYLGDLVTVLDRLGVRQAALVGHSAGGGTAIGLALAQPDRVSALVLMAPGLQDYPWPEDDPYVKEFDDLFAAGDRDGLMQLGLRTWAAASADPAAREQIASGVAAFFALGDYELPDPPGYLRLGEIGVPSVVAIGDLDYAMVRECARHIAGRIPGSSLVVVPGADHLLPLRAPALLAELIAERVP